MRQKPTMRAKRIGYFTTNIAIESLIRLALKLPYETRVKLMGRLMQAILGPLAGYRRRALDNLALIWPDLPAARRRAIAAACLNNFGRTVIENYSSAEFTDRMAETPLQGPGVAAFEQAVSEGRPVILVSGHYGNYEAVRAALIARGFNVGGLYRKMRNPYFDAHYVRTLEALGGPVFAQGRRGTSDFVRHLKSGGQLVLLFDQHAARAPRLQFLGKPAHTALSAAELSLRYNALLVPFYGIRNADGLAFDLILEAPIAPAEARDMMQALSDNLAQRIKDDPTQWFWVHRRWR